MLLSTRTGLHWRKSRIVAEDGNHPEGWEMQGVVGFEPDPWKPPCSMCAFWERYCPDPSSSAVSLTTEGRQPKTQLLHGPPFEHGLENGYQEHCVASYMLPSKHGNRHCIFATVGVKTLVLGFFFAVLHLHFGEEKKKVFSCSSWNHRTQQVLEAHKDVPVWAILVVMNQGLHKAPEFLLWDSERQPSAQRSILLFLCLPGTWGKEIVTFSVSLVERKCESINRGCPLNKISSSYNFRNKIIIRPLPFYAVPDLNFKMPMANT